jgi:hypothetical protein
MGSHIDRETVHTVLHRHVGQFAEMIRVVLLKYGDRPAGTGDVDARTPGIKMHNV